MEHRALFSNALQIDRDKTLAERHYDGLVDNNEQQAAKENRVTSYPTATTTIIHSSNGQPSFELESNED
ncbi:unnamed protein product [Didymodactylos carnosus]|uniref:Uncharacterized protein n=1 Tax=Didymodactylos carnosus TaxID=1234261 RepID=A0A8S2RGF1_9BILA|nr:unnamed protein product [Didymodactylos carnosus]CAF4159045.1 unnamed protein product [Didymodactylos carnosus]